MKDLRSWLYSGCGFESELSYKLVELLNMCLKEYLLPNCCKALSKVPVFKNAAKGQHLKTTTLLVFDL